jgi:hypothetical protein
MRSGARGVGRELTDQVRRALGQGGAGQRGGDVWEAATTRSGDDSGEAPECAWCPVCRAARRLRQSGPGLGTHIAEAGDALAAVVQEAYSAFEAAVKAQQRPSGEAQQRPSGEAQQRPSGEAQQRPSGEAQEPPAEDTGRAPDDRR